MAAAAEAGIVDAVQRHCVDRRDLSLVGRFGFAAVPLPYRLWIWDDDLAQVQQDLGLAG